MTVKVEQCWNGRTMTFRLNIPHRGKICRELVGGDTFIWDKATATDALNLIERLYKVPRRNVRFAHS